MVRESRSLQNDVLAPDDVVVLLDGSVNTVANALNYQHGQPLHILNYRLLSLRSDELNDAARTKEKIHSAIAALESGTFDAMFMRAAAIEGNGPAGGKGKAISLRDRSLEHLHHLLADDQALSAALESGKSAVQEIRAKGIHATGNDVRQKAIDYISADNSPVTHSMDKLFTAERMPFVLWNDHNSAVFKSLPGYNGIVERYDSKDIYLHTDMFNPRQTKRNHNISLNLVLFDQLTSQHLGIIDASQITRLPGTDFEKTKYQQRRKRGELKTYNRTAHRYIDVFADEQTVASRRANSDDPDAVHFDTPSDTLAETHHLLTYYTDPAEQAVIRNRFNHAVAFHDAAMAEIDRRIDQRLQDSRLPPPSPALPGRPELGNQDRPPRSSEEIVAKADHFARSQLPNHYKLRVLLQPHQHHPIILKLTDDNEHTVERTITTFQPNADQAREIKQKVQDSLLRIPGITAYRDPMRTSHYHINDDEFIPAPVPRSHVTTKYGEYRLQLQWPGLNEEINISLGVPHDDNEASHAEANLRAREVEEYLAIIRERYPQGEHLPVTRSDVIANLRDSVMRRGQEWEELTREPIESFPTALRLPFSGPNND